MTTSTRTALALSLALALGVVGCSSDGETASTEPTTNATASGADTTLATPVTVDPASIAAEPSAGCGTPEAAGLTPGDVRVDTTSGGQPRWYFQQVPTAHDGETPMPLVVDLHGYSEGAEVHRLGSGMGAFGEAEGFATITPNGQANPVPLWAATSGSVDSDFLDLVLDEAEANLCIDTNRVYFTGHSNGAFMTSAMVCDHADRIAAAAPVSGIQLIDGCDPANPVPIVTFHGTEDPFVPYSGGVGSAVSKLPSPDGTGSLADVVEESPDTTVAADDTMDVQEVTAVWAERNGCNAEVTEEKVADDITTLTWDCPNGADTVVYRIEGGGHTWPGSEFLAGAVDLVGTTTFSIDANEVMWEFFQQHPRGVASSGS